MNLPADQTFTANTALATLYQRHVQAVLGYIRGHVTNRDDAEDVLTEVFLAALERNALAGLSHSEQLAWLRRVASNKCTDLYRRAQRRPSVALESVAEMLYDDERHSPDRLVERGETIRTLYQYLAQLPEQQQIVLRLRFAHEMTSLEIGQILNKSDSTVRMTLARALNRLRAFYANDKGNQSNE